MASSSGKSHGSAAFTAPAGLSIITTSFAEGPARNKALSIYTATGANPEGMSRRRQFHARRRAVAEFTDEVFGKVGEERGDAALLAALNAPRGEVFARVWDLAHEAARDVERGDARRLQVDDRQRALHVQDRVEVAARVREGQRGHRHVAHDEPDLTGVPDEL